MSRLIVVSNRVNPPTGSGNESVGGLAMALAAALREYSGIWFGWSGRTAPEFSGQIQLQKIQGVTVATVDLDEQDVLEYYNGYANKTLWPLFHYRIDLTQYDRSFGEGYERVNKRFAETLAPLVEAEDLIWIHDYHMIPMARELRRRGIGNPIGFFLHIPWPARQLVTTLPRHRRLVESMFEYDLIGFHTEEWAEAFRDYVVHELGGEVLEDGRVSAFGRSACVGVFPIGIDAEEFMALGGSEAGLASEQRMRESLGERRMIVGVDRLDYSKGLEERLAGYEHLLASCPELRERVFLLQISPISRDDVEVYQELRNRLDALSGRINGEYSTVDWVPIRYVNRMYRRDELAGIYRAAAVGLVTPLRDGMNLVAKEYVAAQNPRDPGVLVLSRFAGAAGQLKDALIVNPFSMEEVADALKRALSMEKPERVRRWESLIHNVCTESVDTWRDRYVERLKQVRVTAPDDHDA
ncbi:MAG TPA: trehalose-6-phosphate synthase [Caulobacteraceae bacterium]|jgi:trehalose 6-phosphate synthase